MSKYKIVVSTLTILLSLAVNSLQATEALKVTEQNQKGAFPLVDARKATAIYYDAADAEVVKIAAEAFQKDVESITGIVPALLNNTKQPTSTAILIGTLGKSALIDELDKKGKLQLQNVRGKWETFSISIVDNPFAGVEKALVIVGSDRRGTAFGVFELSRMMGVSPLCWWADVTPKHRESIYVTGSSLEGPPSIKFRGIFLNDEDWGLQPWAAKKMDADVKDIGPNTYAHIFELLLRLKANFLWPAMHDCTKAFYYYPENPKTADRYGIVVGGSHCEPMLRNNVFEWVENYEHEYGVKPGEWRYDTNKDQIYHYWEDRAKQSANFESVYTVGMRGVHDGSMPGPKSRPEKIKLLEQVIDDQRGLLTQYKAKPITEIPQLFCPYKEVLQLYQGGLKLPDDVTIVWADDNHGYIRQLSNPEEQKRSGGSGVYYHLSYWGAPHDYLWLNSTAPSLISYELTKAQQYGASKLWVINVGDIKPAELETQFSMDLAWNIGEWAPEKASLYVKSWAAETFGDEFASSIAHIKSEYYRLSQCGKPEHLGMLAFDEATANERLRDYQAIAAEAEALSVKIPKSLQDAYFQLILYPVQGAKFMNEKFIYAQKSRMLADKDDQAIAFAKKAKSSFDQIRNLTTVYNTSLAGGKWEGMMSWHPRNLQVYFMPRVAPQAMSSVMDSIKYRMVTKQEYNDSIAGSSASARPALKGAIAIAASDFTSKKERSGQMLTAIPGLGLGGQSISLLPFTIPSVPNDKIADASYAEYNLNLSEGGKTIIVKCLPTQGIHEGRKLRYAISVNGDTPQVVDVNNPKEDRTWKENVLRGFSVGKSSHTIAKAGKSTIRIYLLDAGLALSRVEIW